VGDHSPRPGGFRKDPASSNVRNQPAFANLLKKYCRWGNSPKQQVY